MKRRDLIAKLEAAGCVLARQCGPHDWYRNVITGAAQPVPRHREIDEMLARKIIKVMATTEDIDK